MKKQTGYLLVAFVLALCLIFTGYTAYCIYNGLKLVNVPENTTEKK